MRVATCTLSSAQTEGAGVRNCGSSNSQFEHRQQKDFLRLSFGTRVRYEQLRDASSSSSGIRSGNQ